MSGVTTQQLWFTAPQQVMVREQGLPAPAAVQVLVKVRCSAVSAGTELLVYRGQLPADGKLDTSIVALQNNTRFPLQYGYACVGDVVQTGAGVDAQWRNR